MPFVLIYTPDPEGNFYFAMGCPVRAGGRGFERMGQTAWFGDQSVSRR
jgi:hypothetical protein